MAYEVQIYVYTSIYTSPDVINESTNSFILEGVSQFWLMDMGGSLYWLHIELTGLWI